MKMIRPFNVMKFVLSITLAFCFAACQVHEDVDIRKDGSGQFTSDIDISQMIDIMQTYMSKEDLEKKGMVKMDTTILLKDVVDTVSTLSSEKKALLRPGRIHVKLDMDAKVFTIHSMFPFTNQTNLQQLYSAMNDIGNAKLLGSLGGGGGDAAGAGPSPGDVNQFSTMFVLKCRDGYMSKKLDTAKFNALKNDPQMAQIKQASQMGMEIGYTNTISLPRPVKKVSNPVAKLSDDKMTVTMKFNLIDVLDHPEQFEYTIEY
jgi:hypothetical protein